MNENRNGCEAEFAIMMDVLERIAERSDVRFVYDEDKVRAFEAASHFFSPDVSDPEPSARVCA